MALLNRIDALQASEFFEPSRIGNPELDPPVMTIKIWEAARAPSADSASVGEPALVLRIGKHDALRKTVFARLENDQVILALPDTILEVLPRNAFAFRDLDDAVVESSRHSQAHDHAGGENRRARAGQGRRTQSVAIASADRCPRRHAVGHPGAGGLVQPSRRPVDH